MRAFDSPISSSHHHPQTKLKNHESPISKLTNLTDTKMSYANPSRTDSALNDKSNQVFVPKNAAKYVEEPFERKNRDKEIDQIRKKYFDNPNQKSTNRPVSQKYEKYEMQRENEPRSIKKDENGREYNENIKRSVLITNRQDQPFMPSRYGETNSNKPSIANHEAYLPSNYAQKGTEKQHQKSNFEMTFQPNQLNPSTGLDRISQASNSNYETVTKTLETLSPQRNRIKSSFVVEDRSTKRKLTDANGYYFVDTFKNKQNQSTVVKETTSVYNESATRMSHANSHYDQSAKSNKFDPRNGRNEPGYLKPFTLEDSHKPAPREASVRPPSTQASNSYPTIYDNFLPKNSVPSTQQKLTKRQEELQSRPRTYTEDKRQPVDRVQQNLNPLRKYDPQENAQKRVLKFQDDEKIKEIEKRLKDREAEFKKREQQLRSKCENTQQYDRRTEHSQNKQSSLSYKNPEISNHRPNEMAQQNNQPSQSRPNVEKEIERLSMKIKEHEDRKKQLNIPGRSIEHPASKPKTHQNSIPVSNERQYEDARKALEEFRHGGKVKSTSEVYQVGEYQIGSANNEESNVTVKKYLKEVMSPTEQNSKRCEFIEKTKPMYSERTLPTPRRGESSNFGFKLFKIESEADESSSHASSKITVNSSTSNHTNSKQCKSQFEIHRRTDDGIEQRKKKLQENSKSGNPQEMKRLVGLLSQQTIYDEEFRNCKIWFQNERNENKWKELRRELRQSKEVNDKFTDLKDGTIAEFHICEEENNPFFSVNQQSKFSYQSLVKAYMVAKSFWEENIVKKFSRSQLKGEGFTLEKFDLEKKGHINMEDLVRFLNFESGNFYRNRDLVLIFKRLLCESGQQDSGKALEIEKILRVIGY